MKQPETKLKEKVLADLKSLGDICWGIKTNERSRRGVPDILCCIRGGFFAFELKSSSGHVDRLQEITLSKIKKAGGVAVAVYPDTWDDLFQAIKEQCGRRIEGGHRLDLM